MSLLLIAGLLASVASLAEAQDTPLTVYVVDNGADAGDTIPGDGLCATVAGGCTLRAAIEEANAVPGAAQIDLPPGAYALAPDAAPLTVTDDLTVAGGEGTFLVSGGGDGIVRVSGGTVVIQGVDLLGGKGGDGGALLVDGDASVTLRDGELALNQADRGGAVAVLAGSLTLEGVAIARNTARVGGGILVGGSGSLVVREARIVGNRAVEDGGGVAIADALAQVTIDQSALLDNDAGATGGGASVLAGSLVLRDSIVDGNRAARGGGLAWTGGDGELAGSTISANTSDGRGGGILFDGSSLELRNTTISGNLAGDWGGGLRARSGIVFLDATTIALNEGTLGGGVSFDPPASVEVRNTLFGPNLPEVCGRRLTSLGGNVDPDDSCGLTKFTDHSGVDADLGPLGLWGGRTETHTLGAESVAIDAGDPTACLETDQRGRPRDALCDVGAYEVQRGPTLVPGWNLVGWLGAADAIESATAGLADRLGAAFGWVPADQGFQRYAPDAPPFLNTLSGVAEGDGLWIFLSPGDEIVWAQGVAQPPGEYALVAGFNLVVWAGSDAVPIADALADLASVLDAAFGWDAATQAFTSYSPTAPAILNTMHELRTGEAFWVKLAAPIRWDASGS